MEGWRRGENQVGRRKRELVGGKGREQWKKERKPEKNKREGDKNSTKMW